MKKKAISLLLCTVMLLCMLTGCIHQDTRVKMNSDGTGSVTTKLGIAKDFYEQLTAADSDPFEVKSVTEYQHDGTTYVSYSETKEYASYADMEKALLAMTYETDIIGDAQNAEDQPEAQPDEIGSTEAVEEQGPVVSTKDNHIFSSVKIDRNRGIFYSSYTFNAVLNPQKAEGGEYDLNEAFRVTLSVEMPGKITGAKGGSPDGNKIVFDIADITENQKLTAASEENHNGVVIGMVVGLVVLAGGLFCVVKLKRK